MENTRQAPSGEKRGKVELEDFFFKGARLS
jgi:hypothetical protein